jgi:hypothetical protein
MVIARTVLQHINPNYIFLRGMKFVVGERANPLPFDKGLLLFVKSEPVSSIKYGGIDRVTV